MGAALVAFLFAGLAMWFILGGISFFDCQDSVLQEKHSPDEKYIATLIERNCGATTDYTTIVNLRRGGAELDSKKDNVLVLEGKRSVTLLWNGENQILLVYSAKDIFHKERKWAGIRVVHRQP